MAAENMSTGIYEMFVTKSTQNLRKIYELLDIGLCME
jgi:hypothetical protein